MRIKAANMLIPLIIAALLGDAVALMVALKPQLVTFDKTAMVGRFVGQLSKHDVSDDAIRTKTQAFGEAMKRSLDDYAQTHGVIILNKSEVMAGARDAQDITESIAKAVSTRMRVNL